MPPNSKQLARFWAKVDVRGPDECWPWLAGLSGNGYGRFKLDGRDVPAHRVAYACEVGPIPDGAELLHGCDTPVCCNPRHLTPGTHRANMADMAAKGRAARTKGAARLSPAQVLEIRRAPGGLKAIAERFGIAKSTASVIRSGKSWADLPMG